MSGIGCLIPHRLPLEGTGRLQLGYIGDAHS
jgi:hypothetical protein